MLKLGRVTKVKVFFLVLLYVFNIDLFEFSSAILEKGLLTITWRSKKEDVCCEPRLYASVNVLAEESFSTL